MKIFKKKFVAIILVCLIFIGLQTTSLATNEELLALKFSKEKGSFGDQFINVFIDTKKENIIADGKLVINYDSKMLSYLEIKEGNVWGEVGNVIYEINDKNPGKLILTFAGIEEAKLGTIFELKFKALAAGETLLKIDGSNSSITGGEDYVIDSEIIIDLEVIETDPDPKPDPDPIIPTPTPVPRPEPKPQPFLPVVPPYEREAAKPSPKDPVVAKPEEPKSPQEVEEPGRINFIDVKESDYFKDAVEFVYGKKYMMGISDNEFGPNIATNRAMIVTILWRMSGEPEANSIAPFKDVKESDYFAKAVNWAYENDITAGLTEDTFGPEVELTREQLVTLCFRYAKFRGLSTSTQGNLNKFKDAKQVSKYAVESMTWAVEKGIVSGTDVDTLSPKGLASRGQLAAIIARFSMMYFN